MNIVMLGHSNAGKTTYMASMYAAMSQGVNGFRVRAVAADDHHRLSRAADAIVRASYPPPSDQRQMYALRLSHGSAGLVEFTWSDYRGGALLERSSSDQSRQLRVDLRTADAIVLFADAQELLTDARAGRRIRSLMEPVATALTERTEVTPVVIAITKYDLVPESTGAEPFIEPFRPLIDAVGRSEQVYGTWIPLACGPRPMNVTYPVLWCLFFGVAVRAQLLRGQIDAKLSVAQELRTQNTLGNRFLSWMRSELSPGAQSDALTLSALRQYQELQPLVDPAQKLGELIDGLPNF